MKSIPQLTQEYETKLQQVSETEKPRLLIQLASLYAINGQLQKLPECAEELLKLADKHDNLLWKMEAALVSADFHYNHREFQEAEPFFQQIEQWNQIAQDREIDLKCCLLKSSIAEKKHHFEEAIHQVKKLQALIKPKFAIYQAKAHYVLARLHQGQMRFEQSLSLYFESLAYFENVEKKEVEEYHYICMIHARIAIVYHSQQNYLHPETKDFTTVRYHLEKAIKIANAIQDILIIGATQLTLGMIEMDLKNYDKAIEYFEQAGLSIEAYQNPYNTYHWKDHVGGAYIVSQQWEKAAALYESMLPIALQIGEPFTVFSCHLYLANGLLGMQKYKPAQKYAEVALSLAEKEKNPDMLFRIYPFMAHLHKTLGNAEEVFDYLERFVVLKTEMFSNEKEKSIIEMQTRYETEKKEQEAQQLRELEQMKSRFFSQITHEFRTPLTLILGPVQQLLQSKKAIPPRQLQKQLQLVQRNGQRLSNLVNQLLDLSKLESGKMSIQKKQGDVIAFVKDIAANFKNLALQQNIHFHFETSLLQFPTHFDADMLEKILTNLLSNAFKFTPSDGEVKLQLQSLQNAKSNTTNLQITVADTGRGIAEQQLPHIFDRFYQGDNSNVREVEGSGVGLSLVKELIELQNGTIEVKSELGKGTTFTFHIPIEESTERNPNESLTVSSPSISKISFTELPPTAIPTSSKADSENKTKLQKESNTDKNIVLVVEDNPDMQTYIESILSPQYRVLQAFNGEEGVNSALEEVPDLIVSDVMMPKKDGYTLCKELKTNEKTNHIPILLLTAKAALDSRIEGLQQGADVYLSKPFSPQELLLNIENQIKVRQQLQEKYSQALQSPQTKEAEETVTDPFLQKLIETIESHINDLQLSVEQLSHYMFMSRQQIHRKLRALTSYSTSEFIRLIRLRKAKDLLETKQYSMTEIAYEVGFSTPSYFSRSFAKQYGVVPSKWTGENR